MQNGSNYFEQIKNKTISFKIDKGTTEADCLGSQIVLQFYSKEVIEVLNEHCKNSFVSYEIITESQIANRYYYIEAKNKLPGIQYEERFKEPDLKKYCQENNINCNQLINLSIGSKSPFGFIVPFYADFSKWDGSKIFSVENSSIHLITNDLKDILKKKRFKNLKFEKKEFLNQNV